MHRPPNRTACHCAVSCFRGPRRRCLRLALALDELVAPPEGWGESAEDAGLAGPGTPSGRRDSSFARLKAPSGRWQGRLRRLVAPSCVPAGAPGSAASQLPVARCPESLSETSSLRRYSHSTGHKGVDWFTGNPVLLRCVGNTLMCAQFARVNRDNGFGDLH